uniref:Uncharacterized protein n=1 Tax=Megaselia scalaris TaxID=36166 RepID=T1GQI6_MEGSC
MTLSEYSRPNRVGYTNTQSSPQVRVSIVTLPNSILGGGQTGQQNSNSPVINGNGGDFSTTIDSQSSRFQHSFGAGPSLSIDSRLGGGNNGAAIKYGCRFIMHIRLGENHRLICVAAKH